jgi:hypothetical protein
MQPIALGRWVAYPVGRWATCAASPRSPPAGKWGRAFHAHITVMGGIASVVVPSFGAASFMAGEAATAVAGIPPPKAPTGDRVFLAIPKRSATR